jgi:hypothetical protein
LESAPAYNEKHGQSPAKTRDILQYGAQYAHNFVIDSPHPHRAKTPNPESLAGRCICHQSDVAKER